MRSMDGTGFAVVLVGAGIGIPVMAALSGSLGARIESPPAATAILFGVAFAVAAAVTLLSGPPVPALVAAAPKHLFLGGLCVVFYALSITFIGPRIGVANAILFVLLGQVAGSAIIDHFGLFGALRLPVSGQRLIGLCVIAVGLHLAHGVPRSLPT